MFASIAARRRDGEEGFTLIELMVVVLIIAILIAIAIPTFLGARQRAQDRAAQSSLRNGLTAAKTIFTDQQDYTNVFVGPNGAGDPIPLQAVEPSLHFVLASLPSVGPTSPNMLSVGATTTTVTLAGLSKSGTCFWIKDDVGPGGIGTQYAKGTPAANGCTAAAGSGETFGASW